MPFGSAGSVRTRADTPHCMSFSNKACFHGDNLSPSCATFYGSRVHNVSAVSYPIFSSPSFLILSLDLFYFLQIKAAFFSVKLWTCSLTWTISCLIKMYLKPLKTWHRNSVFWQRWELTAVMYICCCLTSPWDAASHHCHFFSASFSPSHIFLK